MLENKRLYYFLRKLYTSVVSAGLLALMLYQFQLMWVSTFNDLLERVFSRMGNMVMLTIYAVLIMLLFHVWGGFKYGYLKYLNILLSQILGAIVANVLVGIQLVMMVAKIYETKNIILHMMILSGIDIAIFIPYSAFFCWLYLRLFKPLRMLQLNGAGDNHLALKLQTREDKYQIAETIDVQDMAVERVLEHIGNYDAVLLNEVQDPLREQIMQYCYLHTIRVYFTPRVMDIFVRGTDSINLFDTPILLSKNMGLSYGASIVKRIFDIVASLAGLVLLSPVMLMTAVFIKLEDHGPVIYKQERCTMNGRKFWIYKFRSMIVNAEGTGEAIPAIDGDERITKIGRIIRRYHIDELPQLVNVLKGDMSIVGPRPERIEHVEKYSKEVPEFYYRLKVRGGLTGYAQVYGKYNTTPADKLKMDLQYIVNYSFLLD